MGHETDSVPLGAERAHERINDAFDAAVANGRHRNHRIGGEEDFHAIESGRTQAMPWVPGRWS